jgi:N-acetylmuramoyl-L-alanine amidase
MKRLRLALLCLALTHSLASGSAVVMYLDEQGGLYGYLRPDIADPESAVTALTTTPSVAETGHLLTSGIPAETRMLGLQVTEDSTVVEFSSDIIGSGLDDARLENIFRQVKGTLGQFGLPGNIRLQCAGRLLSSYLPPVKPLPMPPPAKAAATPTANLLGLAGKKISISPGHGLFWSGSGWANARPVYCAPLLQEDYNNIQIASFLDIYLAQEGVTVKDYRCVDQNYGTYTPANNPWWHMAACYWTQQKGYPCSVYASYTGDCNLASGGSESNDAIRAGPVAADYDNTDAHIALHSNGSSGYCVGTGCPTGTETYYDSDPEHAAYTAVSKSLATYVHNSVISTIRTKYTDSTWTSRGVIDAAGAYAETRIPQRPAILIELAFHDTCDHDALDLRDNFFLSTAMWAVYKGICDYFGTTPTWDYYSYEALSNSLPATMTVGSTTTATITLRNRGVLWNDAKQFRLGAVGDSDSFGTTTRYNVGAEISPSQIKTFTITLTAPATPGTYTTDWQMVREAVTWFGPTVSKSIAVIDTVAPSAPTNLTATAVAFNRINLAWAPSTDNVGVSNYLVYRDSVFIGTSSTTSYADTACNTATTYSYQVSAIDASRNESAKSIAAQATTPDNQPPTVPPGLTATPISCSQINLSWASSTDNVGVSNYLVYRGSVLLGSSVTTNYSDTSCTAATPYSYQVSAVDAALNESAKSVSAQATTLSPPPPILYFKFDGGVLTLTWTNAVLQEAGALTGASGDWSDVDGANSPYRPAMTAGMRFYRLR